MFPLDQRMFADLLSKSQQPHIVSLMPGDDDQLIARAKKGETGAFSSLVRTYQRRVYMTALHMTGNHGDADDVVQETFLRAYRGLAKFDGRSDFFTWLYRITINTSLNAIRARKRVGALADKLTATRETDESGGSAETVPLKTPAEWLEIDETFREILTALFSLSESLRVTLVLATIEGMSYQEIAEVLEIPEGTVGWRVSEARKQLRALLEEQKTRSENAE